MSKRNPKEPWLHDASGFWCKKITGKLHYLDRDYHTAKRKLVEIFRDQKRRENGAQVWLDVPFADLCDEFLDDTKARRAEETYKGYRYRLLRALKILSDQLRVGDFRRLHMTKIEQAWTGKISRPVQKLIRRETGAIVTVYRLQTFAISSDVARGR